MPQASHATYRRAFPLPAFAPGDDELQALAATMADTPSIEDGPVPAGYTYLAQLVDHDLTFDATTSLSGTFDPDCVPNFSSARLDLEGLYGGGPTRSPYLYCDDRLKFRLAPGPDPDSSDLPRNPRLAVIPEPRNDENVILSQMHLLWLHFHNRVVERLSRPGARVRFEDVRRIVLRHYQWIVVHDLLSKILRPDVHAALLARIAPPVPAPLRFGRPPRIPVEFAVAAYRMGHSMVRSEYALNAATRRPGLPLFDALRPDDMGARDLKGFRQRQRGMTIDWSFFFVVDPATKPQCARRFDVKLTRALLGMPGMIIRGDSDPARKSLAHRNLLRGRAFGLPCGQAVANALQMPKEKTFGIEPGRVRFRIDINGVVPPSTPADLAGTGLSCRDLESRFAGELPLWYYILKEAEHFERGATLGAVGSHIVAEVFAQVLLRDPAAYVHVPGGWQPRKGEFGCGQDGRFEMADLIRHVG